MISLQSSGQRTLQRVISTLACTLLYSACLSRTPEPRDEEPPRIDGIEVVVGAAGSATVTWQTDEPTTGAVLFGLSGAFDQQVDDEQLGLQHSTTLPAQPPSTVTHYRIVAVDPFGNQTESDDLVFVTPGPAGTLDVTFGDDGVATLVTNPGVVDWLSSMALDANGRIVVGGTSGGNLLVARFLADGALDVSFGTVGFRRVDMNDQWTPCYDLIVQPDQRILCVGASLSHGVTLARFEPSGQLDAGFGTAGLVMVFLGTAWEYNRAAVLDGDHIVAVGAVNASGPNGDLLVTRWDGSGIQDEGWTLRWDVTGAGDAAQDVVRDSAGSFIIAGSAEFGGVATAIVTRLTSSGQLDSTFGIDGLIALPLGAGIASNTAALTLDADGRVLVAGSAAGDERDFLVARVTAQGEMDATFGNGGIVTLAPVTGSDDRVNDITVQPDGKILIVGSMIDENQTETPFVARLEPDGELDLAFGPDATGWLQPPLLEGGAGLINRVHVLSDGRILLAGAGLDSTASQRAVVVRMWP